MAQPLYILMLSVHGLVRAQQPELGRDADTGGQVKYVVELARALGDHAQVARVDLITRSIDDATVPGDYRVAHEQIGSKATLIRLPFGPRRYLRKEALWMCLDQLVDQCLAWIRAQDRLPDVIHGHYADAGYVGEQLSLLLGVPLVYTAHSLGRMKRSRLLASGRKESTVDRQFNFARRIQAEDQALEHAALVVASTRQEVTQQYSSYKGFAARRAVVIPPGVDLTRFSPPRWWAAFENSDTQKLLERFLREPRKPLILALCRPDTRKNIHTLVAAYAQSAPLRQLANLLVIAGTRDDVRQSEEEVRMFFSELLLDIDAYDLYGQVAIPKYHKPEHVPEIYRYVARSRGVLVNPGLNETFGLTLIEAAATGLPVIATNQGGPVEILAHCRHGMLIDPLDTDALSQTLFAALSDRERWRRWAKNGIKGAAQHYSWPAHASSYVRHISRMLDKLAKPSRGMRKRLNLQTEPSQTLAFTPQLLIADLDHTLIGDDASLRRLLAWLEQRSRRIAFCAATGRTLESALQLLREHDVAIPDVMITSVGTDIRYGARLVVDNGWRDHIRYYWRRDELLRVLATVAGLRPQPASHQSEFKLSYEFDPLQPLQIEHVYAKLRSNRLRAHLIASRGQLLDVVPVRASKGRAIRYLAYKWGVGLANVLVAGDSGNDLDMLSGDTLGVVVGGHAQELKALRGAEQVYFARATCAAGILEGIEHYRFGHRPVAKAA
jgi:sucrose-phosphate synthase